MLGMNNRKQLNLSFPELMMVVGTRALLGAGVALLLADRLSPKMRKTIGRSLVAIGALTTIPLAFDVFRNAGTK
jgi:hypothetical protein